MKSVSLGLDISTSIIGWSIVPSGTVMPVKPLLMGHIKLTKLKDMWDKIDFVKQEVPSILENICKEGYKVDQFYVEDSLKKFSRGKSSAHTIAVLNKFNLIVSYLFREQLGLTPAQIDCTEARKNLGMTLLSTKKAGGKTQKQQAFDFLSESIFADIEWPKTRQGNIKQYLYDEVDAYVISMATMWYKS